MKPKISSARSRAAGGLTPVVALVLVALAAFLSTASSLSNGFAYDDRVIIVENPRVTDPAEESRIWTEPYWGRAASGLFRPLTTWTYAVNHRLHGLQPFGYHLVNVLLHVAAAILVTLVALEFLAAPAAFAAGVLFAVHPVHTEAVANVVGRAELLAAVGFLVAWVLASPVGIRVLAGGGTGAAAAGVAPTWGRRALVAVLYLLAVLAKENAIVLPLALLVVDLFRRRRPDLPMYGLLVAVAVLYLAWRQSVLGGLMNVEEFRIQRIDNVIASLPFPASAWTALSVIGRYAILLVFPFRLSADYSYPVIGPAGAGSAWAWLGLLVAFATAVFLVRELLAATRRVPGGPVERIAVCVGLSILALTLLPVSNLFFPIGTIMGERLLYLPSAGFVVFVAAAGVALLRRQPGLRPVLVSALCLAVILGGWRSLARNGDWKDDLSIFASLVRDFPESARAHHYYGVTLFTGGRVDEGLAEMTRAVEIDPTYVDAWANLGAYKLSRRRIPEARADLLRAVEIDSTATSPLVTLCALEYVDGKPAEAVGWCERAIAMDSKSVDGWYNLALARTALADTAGLIVAYRKATELGSRNPEAWDALAWYLAVSGGNLEEARRSAERAVALRPDGRSYDTLGEVNFRAGNWAGARSAWSRALMLGVENPAEIEQRLKAIEGR